MDTEIEKAKREREEIIKKLDDDKKQYELEIQNKIGDDIVRYFEEIGVDKIQSKKPSLVDKIVRLFTPVRKTKQKQVQ